MIVARYITPRNIMMMCGLSEMERIDLFDELKIDKYTLMWEKNEPAHLDPGGMQFIDAPERLISILRPGKSFDFTVSVDKAEGMLNLIENKARVVGGFTLTPGFTGPYVFPNHIVNSLCDSLREISKSDQAMHTQLDIETKLEKANIIRPSVIKE